MTGNERTVSCPRCGAPVRWSAQSPFRPFCSQRCRLIDLGAWASEEYRVPVADKDEEPAAPSASTKRDTP